MPLQVKKVDVWSGQIDDRPGALAQKLAVLSAAGVNLQFLLARRTPENPGKGLLFVSPIRGAGQTRAAVEAGLARSNDLQSIRVQGPDKPGIAGQMARAIAGAGVSMRGFTATALGRRFVAYIALDSAADAATAAKAVKAIR